jgi:hypothetical protein
MMMVIRDNPFVDGIISASGVIDEDDDEDEMPDRGGEDR